MPAIRVENLVRRYGEVVALDRVSFEVGEGELFGILGPNGAGKTTLINILSTLLRPTSGHAAVAGYPVVERRDEVRRSIGVVFQDTSLDAKLTGRENLLFHAMMYGVPSAVREQRFSEVLSLVELSEWADSPVATYSGGMKRRLEIARGLVHTPRMLFLDEPTLGLDARTRRRIWAYVERLNREQGRTVILTTHYMEEADRLCGRVAIIDRGRIVALDTPKRLKSLLGGDVVLLETAGGGEALLALLRQASWVTAAKLVENTLNLTMADGDRRIPEIVSLAREVGSVVVAVNLHKPSLEDVFLHFTGRSIRDRESESEAAAAGRDGR